MCKLFVLIAVCLMIPWMMPASGQSWKVYSDTAEMIIRDQRDYLAGLNYYQKAQAAFPGDSSQTDTYVNLLKNMASAYETIGSHQQAALQFEKVLRINEKTRGQDSTYATNISSLGVIYAIATENDKALACFQKAKEIRENLLSKKSILYASSCVDVANIYNATGDLPKAEPLYLEAKSIIEADSATVTNLYARCCNGLAKLYTDLGDFERAEPMALLGKETRGLVLKRTHPSYAISCITLANLYKALGQYEKAEPLYLEAREIRRKAYTEKNQLYAASCNILADLYFQMGRTDTAEALYLEAKQIRTNLSNKADYAETCNNLANLYTDNGKFQKAETLALEAKQIWDSTLPAENPDHAINENILGSIYYNLGDYPKAKDYFLQARGYWAEHLTKGHPYFIQSSNNLAKVYWQLQDSAAADRLYVEALEAQSKLIRTIFQFTNEREKELYLRNSVNSNDEYESFYTSRFAAARAGELYNTLLAARNLILFSSQQLRQTIHKSGDSVLLNKYNHWIALKQRLASAYSNMGLTREDAIREMESEADSIEKELSRSSSGLFKMGDAAAKWQEIQKGLKTGEAAVEFSQFRYFDGSRWTDSTYYIALLLQPNRPEPRLIRLFEKRQLDNLLARSRNTRNENIQDMYSRGFGPDNRARISGPLFRLIWQPLEKELHGIHKIYLAPSGQLYRIAFAALPVDSIRLLSDKYQLVQLNSTASVIDQSESYIRHPDKVHLYGGVIYGGGDLEYLQGTEREIAGIRKLGRTFGLSTTSYTGLQATEESIEALNALDTPAVLHIATHGFFFPAPDDRAQDRTTAPNGPGQLFRQSQNPLFRSGILLAGAGNAWKGRQIAGSEDGILTAYKVSNLYFPKMKLVVLSACETALGEIEGSEGVYGLQRAFKMAGAEYLVISLWKVPDKETGEFMQLFYRKMFEGQSVNDAFYHAQNDMKALHRNSPNSWAAWVLTH